MLACNKSYLRERGTSSPLSPAEQPGLVTGQCLLTTQTPHYSALAMATQELLSIVNTVVDWFPLTLLYFWTTKSNLFAPSLLGLNLLILLILAETVSESNNNSVLTTT